MENVASFEPKSSRPQVSRFIYVLFIVVIIIITDNNTVEPSQEMSCGGSEKPSAGGPSFSTAIGFRFFKLVQGLGIPAHRCDAVYSMGNMLNPVMLCEPPGGQIH